MTIIDDISGRETLVNFAISITHCFDWSSISYGTGRGSPLTFFTPLDSQSSFFKTYIIISEIPRVAIAK